MHLFKRIVFCAMLSLFFTSFISLPLFAVELELDELVGDTVIVGFSALDNQHNVVIGRTIAYNPYANDGSGTAILLFTDLSFDQNTRTVRMNRVSFNGDEMLVEAEAGNMVSTGVRGGYASIAMPVASENPQAVYVYHDRSGAAQPYRIRGSVEWSLFPGIFNEYVFDYGTDIALTQAKVDMGTDNIAHIAAGESLGDDGGTRPLVYYRVQYNQENETLNVLNDSGIPEVITDLSGTSAANIAVSQDGQRVAISKNMGRMTMGLIDESSGSDMILWVNDNAGLDWDFDNSMINLTQFANPDPNYLPEDTLAANTDTLRASSGNSIYFDADNTLHFAFETMVYYHYTDQGFIFSNIYYWNEEDNVFIRIADGNYFLNAGVTTYGSMVGMPSLYKDDESGYLWCLYQKFGEPGDTLDDGSAMDAGETTGRLNADMYITCSPPGPYNGKMWYKGINITNTKGLTGALPAGECRHERDGSLARNNDGEYLNISYLVDYDAGNYDNGNGTLTDNPIVYHRVRKQDLLNLFNEQQEFIRNYPMHIDSTGYWEDPLDWAWRDLTAVQESGEVMQPQSFRIANIYPNPFNSMARISFELDNPGFVSLKVYDVLGREVNTILARNLESGTHQIQFNGEDISSGVYFISLESGSNRDIRKIALLR